jgi:hypothetical protein
MTLYTEQNLRLDKDDNGCGNKNDNLNINKKSTENAERKKHSTHYGAYRVVSRGDYTDGLSQAVNTVPQELVTKCGLSKGPQISY